MHTQIQYQIVVCYISAMLKVVHNNVSTGRLCRSFSTTSQIFRERLIILGTGWGSYSVLKNIDKKIFDVIVVSPRNHFLFTPLLCMTTVGTLEFRLVSPVHYSHSYYSYTNIQYIVSHASLAIQCSHLVKCQTIVLYILTWIGNKIWNGNWLQVNCWAS